MNRCRYQLAAVAVALLATASTARADIIVVPIGGALTPTALANTLTAGGSGITINSVTYTVNSGTNSAFFVSNTDAHLNTQLDGLTVVLSFVAPVNAGGVEHAASGDSRRQRQGL